MDRSLLQKLAKTALYFTAATAGLFHSCGTSEIGNPPNPVCYDGNGILFRQKYDPNDSTFIITTEKSNAVLTPFQPTGDTLLAAGETGIYRTGGSAYNGSNSLHYRFRVIAGDTMLTQWQSADTIALQITAAGIHRIAAQARSCIDTAKLSLWSQPLQVQVQ
jgi:hypothetical protein